MCGLAGFIDQGTEGAEAQARLASMLSRIAHRGPDDEGVWIDGPLAIGHRRLSIVDLSPLGHQPMISASGRYVIAFNGEIYNHTELRSALARSGAQFKGHSDTEVLLTLIERDGLPAALAHCVGMFAIAAWDRRRRVLHLARDRFGEKPLYYGWCGRTFLFGSQLRALAVHPAFDNMLDAESVRDVVQRGYVAPDRSIYRQLRQVAPGTCVSLRAAASAGSSPLARTYWDPVAVARDGAQRPFAGSFHEATTELERRLRDAVVLQLQADVPVGAFLSGGVDSSVVTALMCHASRSRVRSYSIGFQRASHNEAEHAKAVAEHLGTDHTEWYVDEAEAECLVPTLADIYDEPLADASQIPTLVLARLVRRDVTVALSGDGGDEVFGGYPKYGRGEALWHLPARRSLGAMARLADRVLAPALRHVMPTAASQRVPWHRINTAAALCGARTPETLADLLETLNRDASGFLAPALRAQVTAPTRRPAVLASYRREAMLRDIQAYLPGDILTKVDRATMSASLESRAPLLDHRLYEFAVTLPDTHLFDGTAGKRILRALLYRLVPREIVDRPKSGFMAPLPDWLRGGLKPWASDMLRTASAARVLDVNRCRRLLDLHCQGHHDLSSRVWPLVTLAAWSHRHLQRGAGST
ncbi:MAG: asparagine synthase (glutamine-hydrolyzing) [Armatimonadota bacterium]|nr:MAG: asparagine synthase (glutamine-hydrolyzing) [Armatimonadota bacterium]